MTEHFDYSSDRHRPTFHFLPPSNWMNDPNGLIHWKGNYHLFYQYNPNGAFWGTMHWGHALSENLIHWKHMPVALTPFPGGPDADGCYSGVAVDVDGVATLMYTGVRGDAQLPCIATSHDDDLSYWEKYSGNPVITSPPDELDTTIFRDHSVWNEHGVWYQVIGSGIEGAGGTALVYRSDDFLNWEFVDSLVSLDRVSKGIGEGATGWECPDFFEIDGRHVLVAAMWDHEALCVGYFVGNYADQQFIPDHEGIVDPGESFYAPQSFTDDAGRRIMFGWLKESRSAEAQSAAGWSGVMTLPRVLSILPDGSLGSAPAIETEMLRDNHLQILENEISVGEFLQLGDIPGNTLELLVKLNSNVPATVNVNVLCSEDGQEFTTISFDMESRTLSLNTSQSSRSDDVEGGVYSLQHTLRTASPVELRIFVDHSIVEVFLNDEKCITGRAYPMGTNATGVTITASAGSMPVQRVDVWEMKSS